MTARTEVMAVLQAAFPSDVRLIPYARDIDVPTEPIVMVRVDAVRPGPTSGSRTYDVALIVCPVGSDSEQAEDSLDALTEDVLGALESNAVANAITWSTAERATFADKFPCYEIKTAATVAIERE